MIGDIVPPIESRPSGPLKLAYKELCRNNFCLLQLPLFAICEKYITRKGHAIGHAQ